MKLLITLTAAVLGFSIFAHAELFLPNDGYRVYIYNSTTVVYELPSSEALKVQKVSTGTDYIVESYKNHALTQKKAKYECQTFSRVRVGNRYNLGLNCVEVKGHFKSTKVTKLILEGMLHNDGTASGDIEVNGKKSSFRAYDPNLK